MIINKDTKLYCSFAKKAGGAGCAFHNAGFQKHGINAIYKSFSVDDIGSAISAMRSLNISGAGITMPYKSDVLNYVDNIPDVVKEVGAANTIVNNDGTLFAYNTDYFSVKDYLLELEIEELIILGRGGFAKAVEYACNILGVKTEFITRKNWQDINDIKNSTVFNCTPIKNIYLHNSVRFIDCDVETPTGKNLADRQASYQFKLYTGLEWPL